MACVLVPFFVLSPFLQINNYNIHGPLAKRTLPADSLHRDADGTCYQDYDVHNLYGLAESKNTKQAYETYANKRAFLVSRSQSPGSGKYTVRQANTQKKGELML